MCAFPAEAARKPLLWRWLNNNGRRPCQASWQSLKKNEAKGTLTLKPPRGRFEPLDRAGFA